MKDIDLDRAKYLFEILNMDRPVRIVDVGASPVNPAPYDAILAHGMANVIGFEPQPSAYEMLQKGPMEGRTVLPYALGDGSKKTLHISKNSGFTSLLKPNPNFVKHVGGRWAGKMRTVSTIPVDTRRLDDIDEIDEFELLKIDIQGSELEVMQNGATKLAKCLSVYTEVAFVPLYVDQPLIDAQMQFLRAMGFELHKFDFIKTRPLVRAHTSRLFQNHHSSQPVDGDAIFVKHLLDIEQLPDQRLKFVAFLADTLFHSFDLAIHVLEILLSRGVVRSVDLESYVDMVPNTRPR